MRQKLFLLFTLLILTRATFEEAVSQIEPTNKKVLFREDGKTYKQQLTDEKKLVLQKDQVPTEQGTYFNAPQLEFRQDTSEYVGSGGVVISYGGTQLQADSGTFSTKTKKAELNGDLVLSSTGGTLLAESGWFDLEAEVGSFKNSSFFIETEGFHIAGSSIEKISELEYEVEEAEMTTCNCADGAKPWSLTSDSIDITAGGYAHAKPFFLRCNDVPVFYSPYFIFPARLERHSGLLIPRIGFSGEHGFQYSQPIFWNVNESTDVILTPFTETQTRTGTTLQVNALPSRRNSIDTKVIFSDESARGDDLKGTQTGGLFDPTFDKNRVGGYYRQRWKAAPGADLPLSFVADGRYVSDDLFVREIEEDKIGLAQDRFTTSRAYVYAPVGDYLNAQLSTEYSQSFVSDQDLVFQRLPEATLDGYRSLRIFGQNPYGLKLVASGGTTATSFGRTEGYEGNRYDVNPKFKIPYYYKNIVEGDLNFTARQTWYDLSDTTNPDGGSDLISSVDRGIYDFGFNIRSVLERIFDIDPDSWLRTVTGLGARNQFDELQRVKHTIEPYIQYLFTPEKNQDDLPLFDSTDRIKERSVVTYGVSSRLIGRFADSAEKRGVIDEITPEEISIVNLDQSKQDEAGMLDSMFTDPNATIRRIRGEKKQVVGVGVRQSYDFKLEDTDQRAWSDVGMDFSVFPNNYFGVGFGSNYDYELNEFSSWQMGVKVEDDRGDHLRTQFSYVEESLSQVDVNLELALTEKLKVGYYTKYDDRDADFIENRLALRIISACDCWKIDLGYRERINPDDQTYTLILTLKGLGDFGQ